MDAQSIYEMPSVSRCLVFVMLSIAALGTAGAIVCCDRKTAFDRQVAPTGVHISALSDRMITAALDLTEFLRFFAKKHTRSQLF